MKITILYFEGCPNHPPVVEMARRVVAEHGLNAEVEEVEVSANDVVHHRFLGSPTVQVDGIDIEPTARERTDFAMSCRVYATPDGLPPAEMLLDAVVVSTTTAAAPPAGRAGFVAIGGSVVTAVLSSACCWVPLLLLAFGASATGASAFFERWRPVFVLVAIAMLALGFYFSYFHKPTCTAGCCTEQPKHRRRLRRAILWGSTVVVAAFIFFPSYVGVLLSSGADAGQASAATADRGDRAYIFDVEGMHCAGCASTLRSELVRLDGVTEVQVDYDTKTARIEAIGDRVPQRVAHATAQVGYSVTLRSER